MKKWINFRICGWDTETIGIEVKSESPVGKGTIICATAFLGPEVNFGNGPSMKDLIILGLMIDNYAEAWDLISEFKEYFEDEKLKKCWHNYGFDRHILMNHGINARY